MKNNYRNKNCLVTGGGGFIGKSLIRELLKLGSRVTVLDNFLFSNHDSLSYLKKDLVKGDVRDPSAFQKLPKKRYHYVFHLGAPSTTAYYKKDFTKCIDITIHGFINAINFAFKNKARFVYATSGSVYSGIKTPHSESRILNFDLLNIYAKNKAITELIAKTYWPNFKSLGVRILAGYGPGEEHKKTYASVAYSFCQSINSNRSPIIWGDGNQRRDFIFIEDIIEAMLSLALNCPEPIINIGTGQDISFNNLVGLINKILKKNIKPIYVKKPPLYLEKTLADTNLLRKYYKKSFTPIEIGLKKTLLSLKTYK